MKNLTLTLIAAALSASVAVNTANAGQDYNVIAAPAVATTDGANAEVINANFKKKFKHHRRHYISKKKHSFYGHGHYGHGYKKKAFVHKPSKFKKKVFIKKKFY